VLLRFVGCIVLAASLPGLLCQQKTSATGDDGAFQISGTLVDADTGQPLPHARVMIAPVTRRGDSTVIVTADDGRFLFTGLTPGKYSLSAQARRHLTQAFNQHDGFSSAIAVGTNLESTDLIFKLAAEGSISGTVVDEAGEPVRDAMVSLYFNGLAGGVDATRLNSRAAANDEGAYHFNHLPPGRYLLAVNARPWYAVQAPHPQPPQDAAPVTNITAKPAQSPLDMAYPITFYGGATDVSVSTPIVLGRGERFSADVVLRPVPAVHLVIPHDRNHQTSFVVVANTERMTADLMVENRMYSSGTELVGIPPGRYTVRSRGQSGDDNFSGGREIDIDSNGNIEEYDPTSLASVSGAVESDAGGLPRQLMVRLLNKKTREQFSVRVDEQGNVTFKQGFQQGDYEVSINGEEGIYLKRLSAEGAKLSGRTLLLKRGSNVKLKIEMARGMGNINGVALRDGKPFAGAMVVLVPPDPGHNEIMFRRDQSDSDGSFSLPGVVPGLYTVVAIEKGWELEWTNPAVLQKYLGSGTAVTVQPNSKQDLKVAVQ
jgi:protocatechuate 3,4-dioxygenase beta subunit